jgi:transposase-like protein
MPKQEQTRNETELQKQAFEYYFALGWKRRYADVAAKYEVSASTIKNWSRWFRWQQRVEERDAETTRAVVAKNQASAADQRERDFKMCDLIQRSGIKNILEGRCKVGPKDMLAATQIRQRLEESALEAAEAEGKSASTRNVFLILDNGRGDCTLPHESSDQGQEDADQLTENQQPERDDHRAGQTETA